MKNLILGSLSPRRKEILSFFTLPFTTIGSSVDEDIFPFNGDPRKYVEELAAAKASALKQLHPHATILTADTTVYFNNKVYNKPSTYEEAYQNFQELMGNCHQVFTCLHLYSGTYHYFKTEETKVHFNPLTDKQIKSYLARLDWMDKAGGYTIQMCGGLIVRKIDGCYYNVLGLPLNALRELFMQIGIDLWDHLKPS